MIESFSHVAERPWRNYAGDPTPIQSFLSDWQPTHMLFIGTDSQNVSVGRYTKFSTTVILYQLGRGGRCCLVTEKTRYIENLRERLVQETWLSVETALFVSAIVPPDTGITIHVDVNADPRYKSGRYHDELVGMVVAQGFHAAVKPDAWASSKVADKFSR